MGSRGITVPVRRIIVAAVLVVTTIAVLFQTAGAADRTAGPTLPTSGAYFGSSSQHVSGVPLADRVATLADQLQIDDLQAIRLYHFWNESFPTAWEQHLLERDTLIVLSVDTRKQGGGNVAWTDIATAAPGSAVHDRMVAWADELIAYGRPIVVSLNHEPDYYRNGGSGEAADYVAAYRTFVTVLRDRGAANVKTSFIGVAWNFDSRSDTPIGSWYPGDAWVDWVGADGYNWDDCERPDGRWRSFEEIFDAFRRWGAGRDVRLFVGEFGSVEHKTDAQAKARWLRSAASTLERADWDQFDAVLYWNRTHESLARCHFAMHSTSASLGGAVDLANAPVFSGQVRSVPADEPDVIDDPSAAAIVDSISEVERSRGQVEAPEAMTLNFAVIECATPKGHGLTGHLVTTVACR